jgi:small subunit ribosomal protein S6
MRKYEVMFIVKPTLSDEEKKNVISKFTKILTDNNATITNEKEIGQRELAYEIKDFKSGFYYVINFDTDSISAVSEFDRQAKNTSDIVRHLITRIED